NRTTTPQDHGTARRVRRDHVARDGAARVVESMRRTAVPQPPDAGTAYPSECPTREPSGWRQIQVGPTGYNFERAQRSPRAGPTDAAECGDGAGRRHRPSGRGAHCSTDRSHSDRGDAHLAAATGDQLPSRPRLAIRPILVATNGSSEHG